MFQGRQETGRKHKGKERMLTISKKGQKNIEEGEKSILTEYKTGFQI